MCELGACDPPWSLRDLPTPEARRTLCAESPSGTCEQGLGAVHGLGLAALPRELTARLRGANGRGARLFFRNEAVNATYSPTGETRDSRATERWRSTRRPVGLEDRPCRPQRGGRGQWEE